MQNSKSQADNSCTIELQKTIETASSPTCTKPYVGSSLSLSSFYRKLKMFFNSNEITDLHFKVLKIIVVCQVITSLFALFILPLLCRK